MRSHLLACITDWHSAKAVASVLKVDALVLPTKTLDLLLKDNANTRSEDVYRPVVGFRLDNLTIICGCENCLYDYKVKFKELENDPKVCFK